MASLLVSAAAAVVAVSAAVIAVSAGAVARRWLRTTGGGAAPAPGAAGSGAAEAVVEEKLRAYREIMHAVVALNRAALELGEEQFRHEADAVAFDRESALDEPYMDVNQAYESNFHVVGEGVRAACSEYVDYLATYHDQGAHAGGLLTRAGDVYEAMRRDIGLESLFEEGREAPDLDSDPVPEEPASGAAADPGEFESFRAGMEDLEDLDSFNPRGSDDGPDADAADGDDADSDGCNS
jgi:hypothetical protein